MPARGCYLLPAIGCYTLPTSVCRVVLPFAARFPTCRLIVRRPASYLPASCSPACIKPAGLVMLHFAGGGCYLLPFGILPADLLFAGRPPTCRLLARRPAYDMPAWGRYLLHAGLVPFAMRAPTCRLFCSPAGILPADILLVCLHLTCRPGNVTCCR